MNKYKELVFKPLSFSNPILIAIGCFVAWGLSVFPSAVIAQDRLRGIEIEDVILKLTADVDVPARVQGVIESIDVAPNQRVEKGAVLAKLNDQAKQLDLDRALLEFGISKAVAESDTKIRSAKATVSFAKTALERAVISRTKVADSISESEFSKLKLDEVQAKLQLETEELEKSNAVLKMQLMESQVRQAQMLFDRHKIISPLDGVVAIVDRDAGEWVEPGDTVMRVIGMSPLRAEGFVNAKLVSSKTIGARVQFFRKEIDGEERPFVGVIKFVSDEIDPVNQQKRVWAEIKNKDFLLQAGDRGRMLVEE
ncbi:HlyD family efflux transporter periplasmic adaptor subunit [bacterium]|nr:HlyD family efflux transporter periplasmic adaptor subunit [bacterium]